MESYIYLYPLVTMDVTYSVITNFGPGAMPGMGPMNLFSHINQLIFRDNQKVSTAYFLIA